MKIKCLSSLIIGFILIIGSAIGCSQGYSQQDLDIAYNQGYIDGFNAALGESPETTPSPTATPTSSPSPSPTPTIVENWKIYNIRYQVTEKNDTWWKFSWQLTLKNNTSSIVNFLVNVNFVDRNGFIIDDDINNPPEFTPKEQRTIKGYALIDAELAPNVKDMEAEVGMAYIVD